ncbi:MAG: cobalamin-dependent protein [Sporocytophaga sp.]|nr:cobalamin-dependent protein [Sporocytophaga sp.]
MDNGHQVILIDNDKKGLEEDKLADELMSFNPDCIMIGHTASTAAPLSALKTAVALKEKFQRAVIVYGGVFPSYASESILKDYSFIDIIVRGEERRLL